MIDSAHPFLDATLPIRWSRLTADRVEPDISAGLEAAGAAIDAIAAQEADAAKLTYKSTFGALEEATEGLSRGWGLVSHLDSVCNHPELREAKNAMLPRVSEFYSSIPLNEGLWKVLKAWGESPAVKELDPVRRRFVSETMEDFRESGADLPPDKKKRLSELESELARETQKFSENVLDATNAWEKVVTDESLLDGLPDSARAAARAAAVAKGFGSDEEPAWRFTLHAPSMLPVMEHAQSDAFREEVWRAASAVGAVEPHDNTARIAAILELRKEKAALLGRENFADLVLARRMAGSGRRALGFVEGLHERIAGDFEREQTQQRAYRAGQTGGDPEESMEPWDLAFWAERCRRETYDFDTEELRPYFPMDRVVGGMFELTEKLFGIRVEERASAFVEPGQEAPVGSIEVWHPEVKYYEMLDADGSSRGGFYADWHPRDSKRGGAWMNSLRTGMPPVGDTPREAHVGLMCGNMTAPIEGRPALLTHREVETIFHEFGHLLHHMLGEVPVRSLNGVSVPWDFVELPSQIMENFCWEREALDMFARHHETGDPIPEELFGKMVAARNYLSATGFMRQLSFGKLDLELHVNHEKHAGRDLDEACREILAAYTIPTRTAAPPIARRFTHLFGGPTAYAAGYYSYKWSEVLDADAFTRFQKEGLLNRSTGMDFRDKILSKGNSEPADEMFRSFMGRDPDPEALLRRAGLAV